MKIAIRADGNSQIGIGHLQRCMSIAKEVIKIGHECVFYVSDEAAYEIIVRNNIESICLNTKWNNLNLEIYQMQELLERHEIDVLLIDSYYVTKEYLEAMHQNCKIAYIDDLFQVIYPYDILINYAIHAKEYPYGQYYCSKTKLLLGTQYIPLRNQFLNAGIRTIRRNAEHVLITTGGADHYEIARQLVDVLVISQTFSQMMITVVCGKFSSQFEKLKEKSEKYSNLSLLYDVKNMASLMQQADVAVSAGGTTLYELAAVGTPFVCFTVADNQLDNANGFHSNGLGLYAGDVRDGSDILIKKIVDSLDFLIENYEYRKTTSMRMKKTVDGSGARRIAENIC